MTAIETSGLTERFSEDVVAVDGLDLTVDGGEVFGFLGPNGVGKSTVINMLLDFVKPTSGSATVLSHDPTSEAEAIRRRTGILPEGRSLYERLTGSGHIRWMARANDVDSDAEELLRRVGLSAEAADRAVGAVTGSQPYEGSKPRGAPGVSPGSLGVWAETTKAALGRYPRVGCHVVHRVEEVTDRRSPSPRSTVRVVRSSVLSSPVAVYR